MTIVGGDRHTLPHLIDDVRLATGLAILVVAELGVIAAIRARYLDAPPLSAEAKVMLGVGVLIGNS